MKLLVISTAPLIKKENSIYAYSPYVKEIEIWQKNLEEILFCCAYRNSEKDLLITEIPFKIDKVYELKEFNFTTFLNTVLAFPVMLKNLVVLYKGMKDADAIHLRCPGNIGLLACFVQILFPSKIKSAKYAGNWDAKAKQPLSYKIQRWILSSTFLTKNIKVLVYGNWKNQSSNIKPFFTATYFESEIVAVQPRKLNTKLKMIFVGMLSKGKQPLYAIKIVEELKKLNFDVELSLYGDGKERKNIEEYINSNNLNSFVFLQGNKDRDAMKEIYKSSHFLLLPSKSEGWPKVIAEAMFWGCLPIATNISCVSDMLNKDERGILLSENILKDLKVIQKCIGNQNEYDLMASKAINWSRGYTIDKFEFEIKKILKP